MFPEKRKKELLALTEPTSLQKVPTALTSRDGRPSTWIRNICSTLMSTVSEDNKGLIKLSCGRLSGCRQELEYLERSSQVYLQVLRKRHVAYEDMLTG